jgi:multiple sugar transport system permease protein
MISLFSLINALQLFNEPTALKPLTNAITSTWVPLMRVYSDSFVNNDIYGGAASAFTLLVMTVAVTVAGGAAAARFTRRQSS